MGKINPSASKQVTGESFKPTTPFKRPTSTFSRAIETIQNSFNNDVHNRPLIRRNNLMQAIPLESMPKEKLVDDKADGILNKKYSHCSEVNYLYSKGSPTNQINIIDAKSQTERQGYIEDGVMFVRPFASTHPIAADDLIKTPRHIFVHLGTRANTVPFKHGENHPYRLDGSCERIVIQNSQIKAFVKRLPMDALPAKPESELS